MEILFYSVLVLAVAGDFIVTLAVQSNIFSSKPILRDRGKTIPYGQRIHACIEYIPQLVRRRRGVGTPNDFE